MDQSDLSLTDKTLLSEGNAEKIFKAMHEVLYAEDHRMVRKTSLELLRKHRKFGKTEDRSS